MAKICKKASVKGKVQGVFFRKYTQAEARQLALVGYAKNVADGSVEVLACGESSNVMQLMQWLLKGSPDSQVTSVSVEDSECGSIQEQVFKVL
ncbi:acylphosphatase [Aestuariibacter sp. AA17]|uniref:Acylphosphatase n=1 Tax=Fluctibacter corallii TaxID=2984329 RepID=A0ABT3A6T9_9ALTE|nr:acylphosphatase [Aestuariibacter sp. AA17]MCV2884002.1 acylphosphatase [Aestuariibacter sp. AA17]